MFACKQILLSTWRLAIPVSHKMQLPFYLYCSIYYIQINQSIPDNTEELQEDRLF